MLLFKRGENPMTQRCTKKTQRFTEKNNFVRKDFYEVYLCAFSAYLSVIGFTLIFKPIKQGIWVALIMLFCCQSSEQKPASLLSQEQMVSALIEIYLTEQNVNRLSLSTDSAAQVFSVLEDRIFEKLQVPDSVFRQSFEYYTDHPTEMEKIYGALVDSLQLREQRIPQSSQ
jgi:hypothetical protein